MSPSRCPYCGTATEDALGPDDCCHGAEAAALRTEIERLRAAMHAELTHGGIRDRIAQATAILGAESKKGSPVYRVAERLDCDRDEFYERIAKALEA